MTDIPVQLVDFLEQESMRRSTLLTILALMSGATVTVRGQARMREGVTPEILVDAPDGVRVQLQDVSYCRDGGRLANVC